MRADQKVLVNTLALYAKIVINIVISLYLTRLALNTLGVNDYGIYNLIAGTIAFLSFLNSALAMSSQRYFNVLQGEKNYVGLKKYFSTSLIIHVLLALVFVAIFEIAYLFLFDGFFNIAEDRMSEAKVVYQLTAVSTIVTVIGVPYTSAINANEDLVFFAVVESICSVLKLGLIWLFKIPGINALIIYAAWISFITILGIIIKWYWCKKRYPECQHLQFRFIKSVIFEMLSFSGWNTLGAFAMVCRNQGVTFVINSFWGTAINAVYGIANQVNGQLSYFSQMLTASFSPQIMKSVGEGNYDKLRFLSLFSSKISFYMSAVVAIPLILNMNFILELWLKNVPPYTNEFCSLVIYVFLVMQLYPGIVRAIWAVGNIRNYQIITSLLFGVPIISGILLYKWGFESYSICYAMIAAQFLSLLVTLYYGNLYYKLDIGKCCRFILTSVVGFAITIVLFNYIDKYILLRCGQIWAFVFLTMSSMVVFSFFFYFVVLDNNEKQRLINLLHK